MNDLVERLRKVTANSLLCREAATEIERLRRVVRCEQIKPPHDVADDLTTELAVELAYAKQEIEELHAKVDGPGLRT